MQLAHFKTSPVIVLGPLELLEWQKETFPVGQHHQFSLTKEPLSLTYWNQKFFYFKNWALWMELAHFKTSPVMFLGPLNLLEWPKETFAVNQHHQFSLTKEPLSLMYWNQYFCYIKDWALGMQLAHLIISAVVVLGLLDLLEWQKETFPVGQHHQFSLTKEHLSLMYWNQ